MVKKSAQDAERTVPTEAPWPANTDGWSRAEKIQLNNNMRQAGEKWGTIRPITGLNHALSELEYMRHVYFAEGGELVEFTPAQVRALRDELGYSWGEIMVRVGRTEGAVRAAYKEATGKLSEGTRNGRGGRFYLEEPTLYADVLRGTGTAIPAEGEAPLRVRATVAATEQRVGRLTPDEVRNYAADRGIATKGKSQQQLIAAIVAELHPTATPVVKPTRKRAAKKAAA